MSLELWQKLPPSFLKKRFNGWDKLSPDVKELIVELAQKQNFRCALCPEDRHLEIEHDRHPEEGPGNKYTIYNIRGLACRRCNWLLMRYEQPDVCWENADCQLSDDDYEYYISEYECRVRPLLEDLHERRVGCRNSSHRRYVLRRFDEWMYESERSAWRERWELRQAIKSPEKGLKILFACLKALNEQLDKDPNYEVSDKTLLALFKIHEFLRDVLTTKARMEMKSA